MIATSSSDGNLEMARLRNVAAIDGGKDEKVKKVILKVNIFILSSNISAPGYSYLDKNNNNNNH